MSTLATATSNNSSFVQTCFDWETPICEARPEVEEVAARPIEASPRRREQRHRRGNVTHVGGALVSVLGNYGISVDDLITEIERQRREREVA